MNNYLNTLYQKYVRSCKTTKKEIITDSMANENKLNYYFIKF